MKNGCTSHDTIQEVDSTSLKELDSTSSCVVELHWQNEESIDLLFVLSICFAIHDDKWADRYTLQRYNCYFISWAIITITMRKSAVCRAVFNTGEVQNGVLELEQGLQLKLERELEQGLQLELERALEQALERKRVRVLELNRALELERKPAQELDWTLEWARAERVHALWAERAQALRVLRVLRALRPERAGELVGELARKLAEELARVVAGVMARELAGALAQELAGALAQELAGVLAQEREKMRELVGGLARELVQGRVPEWAQERVGGWAQEWANGLGQIPLVLGLRKKIALAKTLSSRQVVFVISLLYSLIYSNIAWRV